MGLKNTSNPAIDINACEAWRISQGKNISVAVVDNGIYLSHLDLSANIIINSGYEVGVAPKSKIIPISHDLKNDIIEGIVASTFSAQLASGISWAWDNADIINCSWYSNAGWLDSELLEDAIINAIENGRDGKGSLVVFAAGNFGNNGPSMIYPGNFDDKILTVVL